MIAAACSISAWIAWRLHPPQAIADFKIRALAVSLPDAERKRAWPKLYAAERELKGLRGDGADRRPGRFAEWVSLAAGAGQIKASAPATVFRARSVAGWARRRVLR